MRKKNVYIMDPLSPHLKSGNDGCSPYLTILSDIADHFNLAMKLANPTWNDNIFDWRPEFPKWLPKTYNW
jgi:hypothetical protein